MGVTDWVIVLCVVAVLYMGSALKNEGALSPKTGGGRSVRGIDAIGAIAAQLQRDRGAEIVNIKGIHRQKTSDGTRFVLDVMLFTRATRTQSFERITARETNGEIQLMNNVRIAPVPDDITSTTRSASDAVDYVLTGKDSAGARGRAVQTFSVKPVLPPSSRMAYRFETPTDAEYSQWTPPTYESIDFSVLDDVLEPPLQNLSHALAYEKSALAIQYGNQ